MIVATFAGWVALAVVLVLICLVIPAAVIARDVGFWRALGAACLIGIVAVGTTAVICLCVLWAVS